MSAGCFREGSVLFRWFILLIMRKDSTVTDYIEQVENTLQANSVVVLLIELGKSLLLQWCVLQHRDKLRCLENLAIYFVDFSFTHLG